MVTTIKGLVTQLDRRIYYSILCSSFIFGSCIFFRSCKLKLADSRIQNPHPLHQSKMHSNNIENPQKSLQIKQDDKFYSRLMSKETSTANSSSRVYYGGASGAVPFIWESQPGTPKHALYNESTLPPLTPPPSFQSVYKSKTIQKHPNPNNLLTTIFPRLTSKKKNHVSPSSSSWSCTSSSSSSSSYSSSSSSNSTKSKFRRRSFSCSTLPIGFGIMDDDHDDQQHHQGHGSPTSTLCFSGKRRSLSKFRGYYSMMKMKNSLLGIVGHGSGQGTA